MLLSDIAREVNSTFTIGIDHLGFTEGEIEKGNYFELAGEIKKENNLSKFKITYNRSQINTD